MALIFAEVCPEKELLRSRQELIETQMVSSRVEKGYRGEGILTMFFLRVLCLLLIVGRSLCPEQS